ncbi:flagellar basal body rod protein [Pelomonas cellulosilytica]|uniref:Flagellar basal body rod protein n=1 Tax=Pelomonas cellulosilytica TaxID=2906762 RepID=A0ABS8Y5H0_9BURK|nr:flagellar basal body rod protein [Pelomonas sp. P8]MCE4557715.1 flagellar basal body rod protein [Pelomonas sp. P8]
MTTVPLSTALTGISAANERLRASAANIANLAASNQGRTSVEPTNVDKVPEREINPANGIVEQQSAAYAFVANLKVLQTQLNTTGALLDIKA